MKFLQRSVQSELTFKTLLGIWRYGQQQKADSLARKLKVREQIARTQRVIHRFNDQLLILWQAHQQLKAEEYAFLTSSMLSNIIIA